MNRQIPFSKSLLRREEYKMLQDVAFEGEVLDVGGTPKADYHSLIQGTHTMVTANIDIALRTDYTFDAQQPWPLETSHFNGVICMNVLEHLYLPTTALSEAQRVLRPGGKIVGSVPFLFNVHGSPDDYFRYTKSALTRLLSDAGFEEIQVHELGSGAFAVVYHSLMGFMRFNWMAACSMAVCVWLDKTVAFLRPGNKMSRVQFPLGYFFEAKKPLS
ncbi:MAG: methyltransferase domain-containing protein [Patescibacteria group bacterium]